MKNKLSIINGLFLGSTLIIAVALIRMNDMNEIIKNLIVLGFMLINIIKDIVLGKMGFDFSGFGLKKMLKSDFAILIILMAFLFYRFI